MKVRGRQTDQKYFVSLDEKKKRKEKAKKWKLRKKPPKKMLTMIKVTNDKNNYSDTLTCSSEIWIQQVLKMLQNITFEVITIKVK